MLLPISIIGPIIFLGYLAGPKPADGQRSAGPRRQGPNGSPGPRRPETPTDATQDDTEGSFSPGQEFFQAMPEEEITCKQRNKCSKREGLELDFYDQNCFCDELCKLYGDCCKDYRGSLPASFPEGFRLPRRTLACRRVIPIDQTAEIYRVEKCPSNYDDAFVREKCEDTHSLDQFLEIPVSGVSTGILYKNYFCAICAGDADVSFWNVKWQCEKGPDINNGTITEKLLDDVWFMGAGNCIYEFTHDTNTYRKCKSNLSRCPKFWEGDAAIERKCKEATAYTYIDSTMEFMVFGNEHCAQCYGINATYLTCRDPRGVGIRDHRPHNSPLNSFSILLDIPTGTGTIQTRVGEGEAATLDERQVTFRQCEELHVYDPFNKICRRIACPENMNFVQGDCIVGDPATTSTKRTTSTTSLATIRITELPTTLTTRRSKSPARRTTPENLFTQRPFQTPTTNAHDSAMRNHNLDSYLEGHFDLAEVDEPDDEDSSLMLDCPLQTFKADEYTTLKNRSVLIISLQQIFDRDNYILQGTIVYVCAPLNITGQDWSVNGKVLMFQFGRIEKLVCLIGLLISLLFVLICFVIHMMLPPIRTTPGKCIIGLSVSLFIGHGLLLMNVLEVGVTHDIACLVMGIVMHYMFIASFCWTNCMVVDLCKDFGSNNRSNGINSKNAKSNRYVSYSIYSWIFPAFLVGGCVALDMLNFSSIGLEDELDLFRPYYGDGVCWMTRYNALLFLFAVPLAILFMVNVITFIVTIHKMRSVPVVGKAVTRRDKDKNRFILYIKYTLIMALTWTFALLAVMINMQFLYFVFMAFLSLQGAFMCAAFVCTRKVFRLLKTIGRVHKSSNGNSTNNRPYHRAYSTATAENNPWGDTRSNFMYEDMDNKVISQETSI